MSKSVDDLRAGQITENISFIIDAMRALEQKEYDAWNALSQEEKEKRKSDGVPIPMSGNDMTRKSINRGECFGLSAYIMHCAFTEYHEVIA